jgi:hypothetical protein
VVLNRAAQHVGIELGQPYFGRNAMDVRKRVSNRRQCFGTGRAVELGERAVPEPHELNFELGVRVTAVLVVENGHRLEPMPRVGQMTDPGPRRHRLPTQSAENTHSRKGYRDSARSIADNTDTA